MIEKIIFIDQDDRNYLINLINSRSTLKLKEVIRDLKNLDEALKDFDVEELEEFQEKCRIELAIRKLQED